MNRRSAETVVLYYRQIPGMVRLLKQEQAELESEYDGLHATACDGLPHGSAPGKPTETLALRVVEAGVYQRLQEILVRLAVLEADAATIRVSLDDLSGKYKTILTGRLLRGYSWGKISVRMAVPESTARYWFQMALRKLAEVLDEVPMIDELEARASRARSL